MQQQQTVVRFAASSKGSTRQLNTMTRAMGNFMHKENLNGNLKAAATHVRALVDKTEAETSNGTTKLAAAAAAYKKKMEEKAAAKAKKDDEDTLP
jgi:hypothetical protein